MLAPKVSIIIPCYNQGHFLNETLSNLDPSSLDYEVIIINDGSTEKESLDAFEFYHKKNYKIVHQENKGLAEARNTGIAEANGKFILLLDADNCVYLNFIYKAIEIFETNNDVAVIYSDAEYFGSKEGYWTVGEFNLQKIMINNYIDACALVRKDIFIQLGGYDAKMKEIKSGWEDWEMWLRIAFAGKKFRYLPQIGFKYRVYEQSMISEIKNSYEIRNKLTDYIHRKYPFHMGQQYISAFVLERFKPYPVRFFIKLIMMAWFTKYYNKLLSKNKIIRGV